MLFGHEGKNNHTNGQRGKVGEQGCCGFQLRLQGKRAESSRSWTEWDKLGTKDLHWTRAGGCNGVEEMRCFRSVYRTSPVKDLWLCSEHEHDQTCEIWPPKLRHYGSGVVLVTLTRGSKLCFVCLNVSDIGCLMWCHFRVRYLDSSWMQPWQRRRAVLATLFGAQCSSSVSYWSTDCMLGLEQALAVTMIAAKRNSNGSAAVCS